MSKTATRITIAVLAVGAALLYLRLHQVLNNGSGDPLTRLNDGTGNY